MVAARDEEKAAATSAGRVPRPAGVRLYSPRIGRLTAPLRVAACRLMLTALGGLAEFERELIRAPHRRRPRPRQKREALERRERGDETFAEIGRSSNVSGWTIFAARR